MKPRKHVILRLPEQDSTPKLDISARATFAVLLWLRQARASVDKLERKLGRRVAELRHASGITQMQLAERAATTLDTISRLERGASLPGVTKLAVIADALRVPLWQLFRWDGDGAKNPASIAADVMEILTDCDPAKAELIRDVAARIARS